MSENLTFLYSPWKRTAAALAMSSALIAPAAASVHAENNCELINFGEVNDLVDMLRDDLTPSMDATAVVEREDAEVSQGLARQYGVELPPGDSSNALYAIIGRPELLDSNEIANIRGAEAGHNAVEEPTPERWFASPVRNIDTTTEENVDDVLAVTNSITEPLFGFPVVSNSQDVSTVRKAAVKLVTGLWEMPPDLVANMGVTRIHLGDPIPPGDQSEGAVGLARHEKGNTEIYFNTEEADDLTFGHEFTHAALTRLHSTSGCLWNEIYAPYEDSNPPDFAYSNNPGVYAPNWEGITVSGYGSGKWNEDAAEIGAPLLGPSSLNRDKCQAISTSEIIQWKLAFQASEFEWLDLSENNDGEFLVRRLAQTCMNKLLVTSP